MAKSQNYDITTVLYPDSKTKEDKVRDVIVIAEPSDKKLVLEVTDLSAEEREKLQAFLLKQKEERSEFLKTIKAQYKMFFPEKVRSHAEASAA